MDTATFSVIIPTRHRDELLARCLEKLAPGAQTLPAEQYEVIVTDDGAVTTAESMVRECFPWAKWVAGPRRGPAANRNNGAKQARKTWLAFTDDDCLPSAEWLSEYVAAAAHGVRAIEGAVEMIGGPLRELSECPVNMTGGYFWSANIAVERSFFWAVGGFDEAYRLAAHEDEDLYLRVKKLAKVPFVRRATVVHPVRHQSLRDIIKNIPNRSGAWGYHLQKHLHALGYPNLDSALLDAYKVHATLLVKSVMKRRSKIAVYHLAMLIYGNLMADRTARRYLSSKTSINHARSGVSHETNTI